MDTITVAPIETHLAYSFDAPLPNEIFVGKGAVLHVQGWCYSSESPVRRLTIVAGSQATSIPNHSWPRPDVFAEHCPGIDKSGHSLLSGFDGFLTFEPVDAPCDVHLHLRVVLARGEQVDRPIGSVRLVPGHGAMPTPVVWPASGARVAICMATFEPPYELFKAQIESIKAQTHENWVCVVTDDRTRPELYDKIRYLVKGDPRFVFFQNNTRRNFYGNFEEVLRRAPADADFIALSDQDDVWKPEKLEALLAGFDAQTHLVYSDARVVTESGNVQSQTFWTMRQNNHTDLPTLMVANTITGAASMLRASLLPSILPFPQPVGPAFHDHWIGLAALLKGRIGYIDRPLYDYVQHAEGVIGHNYNSWPGIASVLKMVMSAAPRRAEMAGRVTHLLKQSVADYRFVLQKIMLARTLLLRNPDAALEKHAQLRRFARFETSILAVLGERISAARTRRPSLNLEGMFLWSVIGTRLRNFVFRHKRSDLLRLQTERPGARLLEAVVRGDAAPSIAGAKSAPAASACVAPAVPVLDFGSTKWIHHNISPLALDVSTAQPKRVNLLLATIDFKYVFGGYIGMFNLALRLRREGYRTRIILHEQTDWNMDDWRRQIQNYPGITTLFDDVEVISRFDRTIPLDVSPDDRFIATNCWAAHIAHRTVSQLAHDRFLFMVQEYEPYFLPMNSISALFQQSYTFPQISLFSTELLQEFFRRERIGVFTGPDGDCDSAVFSNAIQKFHPTPKLLARDRRRLLFYARPEEHAARNLFELGMIALAELSRDPRVDLGSWSFHGIGSIDRRQTLELAPGVPLELVPKTNLQDYIDLMPSFDVGLSLMLTPHPSLVPLEMASAGMLAVTNTFANKTAERLRALSANLTGVEPTIQSIREGLIDAMSRAGDIDQRLAGAQVRWPTDWNDAFPPDTMCKIRNFLGGT